MGDTTVGIFHNLIGEYNPKIDYLFCRHINLTKADNGDEALWKKCWNNEITPFNKGASDMMHTKEMIEKCASLLENNCTYLEIFNYLELPDILLETFLKCWNEALNKDISSSDRFILECIKNNNTYYAFINYKVAHAILCVLVKHVPTIFYMSQFKKVFENVNKDNDYALQILYLSRTRTEIINEKHIVYTFDEIKEKLISIKDYLNKTYGIRELYIYGSYSKGNQGIYSDLDVYAISENPTLLVNEGVLSKISNTLNLPVDGHVVNDYEKATLILTPEIRRWLKKIY